MNNAAAQQFKSYKVTTKKGNKMLVVNAGVNPAGERVLKVRKMTLLGYVGWSGGARPEYHYADPIWIKESAVAE